MKAKNKMVLWMLLMLVVLHRGYSQTNNAATIAGSFAKFVDIPVSHFTGVPNISVPLYTVSEGPLSAPVALQYHSSGVKVGELASDVGLGWYLQGGGAIYRTVRGLPDEEREYDSNLNRKGYQYYGATVGQGLDRQDIADLKKDGEPDLFSFTIPGGSGKFMFTGGNIDAGIVSGITTIPYQDIKIEVVDGGCAFSYCRIDGFILTTSDGTRYYFGKYDAGLSTSNVEVTRDSSLPNYAPLQRYHSAWYLTKIETHDGDNSIEYEYRLSNYSYKTLIPCALKLSKDGGTQSEAALFCGPSQLPGTEIRYNQFYVNTKVLSKIITRTDTVIFSHEERTDVEDVPNDPFHPQAINGFEVKMGADQCVKYEFDQGYFTDGSGSMSAYVKRLRLDRVRKKACDNSVAEPDYVFSYNSSTTLPHRLSKAIDHWGYYNGATLNNTKRSLIPLTKFYTSDGQDSLTYGSSSRTPYFASTIKGVLETIKYPTGGETDFTYEANMAYDPNEPGISEEISMQSTGSTGGCTPVTYTIQETKNLTTSMIENGDVELGITSYHGNCGVVSTEVELEIIQASDTITLNFDDTLAGSTASWDLDMLGLSTGSTTFKLTVNRQGMGYAHVTYISTGVETEVGGLRIKKIETYDGIDHGRDIIKEYKYLNINGKSSGKYVGKPLYGVELPPTGSSPDYIVVAEAYSLAPLFAEEGYHIGYTYVQEELNGNGVTEYTYRNVENFEHDKNSYPPFPMQMRVIDGTLAGMSQKTEGGTELTFLNQVHEQNVYYYSHPYPAVRARNIPDVAIGFSSELRYLKNRIPLRNEYKLTEVEGVQSEEVIDYEDPLQLGATKISTTNSDGQVYTTEITYTSDYDANPNIKDEMKAEDRHMMGIPYKTEVFTVDGMTEVKVDGHETYFSFFDNSAGTATSNTLGQIYPHEIRRYEVTWNAAGALEIGGYRTLKTMLEYHVGLGLPERIRDSEWEIKYTTYDSFGNVIKSKFEDFETNYIYFPRSNLLQRKEAMDGQFMSYTYDDLVRPYTVRDSCSNVITTYDYVFQDASNANYNKITTTTVHPMVSGSQVGTIVDVEYIDGLGRSVQNVRKDQAQDAGEDIVYAKIYDNQGRVSKVFEPRSYTGNNGKFVSISSGDHTLTEYEASPLNRVSKVTPPFLNAVEYSYGANGASEVSGYGVNLLRKTQVKDGNGNYTERFTDRRGRTILSRRTNGTLENDTYYAYDDKDRLIQALPPGTTSSNGDLIYTYTYDERDHVLTKKVPNKGVLYYRYNDRDLLSYVQDSFLRAQNKWYGYNYDDYGREINSGFANSAGNNNTHAGAVIQEELTENIYGTAAHEIDKLKTSRSKILGSSNWLTNTVVYDDCGRVTSSNGNSIVNIGGTTSRARTFSYDWMDNLLESTLSHTALSSTQTILEKYTYDKVGRQDTYDHKLNGGTLKRITNFDFDHKEQLEQVAIGPSSQQVVNYTYKANGLLASTNGVGLASGDLFYEELRYKNSLIATSGAVAQNNGNIANVISRVAGDDQHVYGMTYDYLDRMEKATYLAREDGGTTQKANSLNNYTVDPTYDVRGNIEELKRYGRYWNGEKYVTAVIDDLDYEIVKNQIMSVADNAPDSSKRHGYQEDAASYSYDGNGNLTFDPRSGSTFTYNHLDLPTKADFGGGKTIDWIYDGQGNMLEKLVKNGSTVMERRRYAGKIEYGGDQIEVIYHDAGRIYNTDYLPDFQKIEGTITGNQSVEAISIASTARIHDAADVEYTAEDFIELESDFEVESGTEFDAIILDPLTADTTWRYDFFIKDHLGNTRVIFNEAEDILAHYEYYPFGMQRNGDWGANTSLNNEKYQYNGIEYVQDHGLNMNMARYRMLDPSLGRWMGVDPKAELMMGHSPYSWPMNNPITYNDPEGDIAPLIWAAIAVGGGALNVWRNRDHVKAGGFGAGLKAFGVGAAAAVVGTIAAPAAGVGATLGATVGSFATAGAVGGAVGGAIEGFGNSYFFGDGDLLDDLGQGISHGVIGGIGGAVLGGITGGVAHWLSSPTAGAGPRRPSQVADEFIDPYSNFSVSGGGSQVKMGSSITDGVTLSENIVVSATRTSRSYADLIGHRAAHILNRHRFGAGKPGKTEFPSNWTDKRILYEVNKIANDPNAINGVGKWRSPYKIGVVDGNRIRVDFYPANHTRYAGRVSTAYPYGN